MDSAEYERSERTEKRIKIYGMAVTGTIIGALCLGAAMQLKWEAASKKQRDACIEMLVGSSGKELMTRELARYDTRMTIKDLAETYCSDRGFSDEFQRVLEKKTEAYLAIYEHNKCPKNAEDIEEIEKGNIQLAFSNAIIEYEKANIEKLKK